MYIYACIYVCGVCISAYLCISLCVCISVCVSTCVAVCMYIYVWISVWCVYMCISVYISVYIYMCSWVHVYLCVYLCVWCACISMCAHPHVQENRFPLSVRWFSLCPPSEARSLGLARSFWLWRRLVSHHLPHVPLSGKPVSVYGSSLHPLPQSETQVAPWHLASGDHYTPGLLIPTSILAFPGRTPTSYHILYIATQLDCVNPLLKTC